MLALWCCCCCCCPQMGKSATHSSTGEPLGGLVLPRRLYGPRYIKNTEVGVEVKRKEVLVATFLAEPTVNQVIDLAMCASLPPSWFCVVHIPRQTRARETPRRTPTTLMRARLEIFPFSFCASFLCSYCCSRHTFALTCTDTSAKKSTAKKRQREKHRPWGILRGTLPWRPLLLLLLLQQHPQTASKRHRRASSKPNSGANEQVS